MPRAPGAVTRRRAGASRLSWRAATSPHGGTPRERRGVARRDFRRNRDVCVIEIDFTREAAATLKDAREIKSHI